MKEKSTEGWQFQGRGKWRLVRGQKFPASLFPGLCKGLIKYGWCLEQSRGKWDSTNSTSSPGRPILLRWSPAIFFDFSVSPSSSSPPSTHFTVIPLFLPPSGPLFRPFPLCRHLYLSAAGMTKCLPSSYPSIHCLSFPSVHHLPPRCFLLSSRLCALSSLHHTLFSLPPCDDYRVV